VGKAQEDRGLLGIGIVADDRGEGEEEDREPNEGVAERADMVPEEWILACSEMDCCP
jgi:hypothetical protein